MKDYYENLKELKKFIESLEPLDHLGEPIPEWEPTPEEIEEMMDEEPNNVKLLIDHWCEMHYPNYHITDEAVAFITDILKRAEVTKIPESLFPAIEAISEFLGITSSLSIFTFGYCWKQLADEEGSKEASGED